MRYTVIVKRSDLIIFSFLSVLFFISCSTMSNGHVAALATDAASMMNNGETEALIGASGTPFLFETEILPAPAQLEALWSGLSSSGYDFSPEGEIAVYDVDRETWKRFSSSYEVEVWFHRHAPEKAALAVWPTGDGSIILIIDRNRKGSTPYRGMKVEQG